MTRTQRAAAARLERRLRRTDPKARVTINSLKPSVVGSLSYEYRAGGKHVDFIKITPDGSITWTSDRSSTECLFLITTE